RLRPDAQLPSRRDPDRRHAGHDQGRLDHVERRDLPLRQVRLLQLLAGSGPVPVLLDLADPVATMDARLTDLEIRYSHLERQFADLSDVVFAQQKTIEALERELAKIRVRLREVGDPVVDEKPPHY